jgi:hypothetical protein
MKRLRWAGLFLVPALLAFAPQAGAAKAKPNTNTVKRTSAPTWALAMDGARVAYASGGKIHVWNVATGATSVIPGKRGYAKLADEVAISGKRVAWINRRYVGNTEVGERLYVASLAGKGLLLGHSYRYGRDDLTETTGGWIAGLVGTGKALAVSTWRTSRGVPSAANLSVLTPTGLRSIASGPGAIVAESGDGGHIAVLRSTVAWPDDLQMPIGPAPSVGVYSTAGALLGEIALGSPDPDATGIQIALDGNRLVVLKTELHEPSGPTTVTLEVYDWTTGTLLSSWPVAIPQYAGEVRFAVHGHLAAVEGPYRLHLVDLDTGKDVAIASSSRTDSPPAINSRGLVYAVNPHYNGPGKLVFVPTARLLALAG